MSYCVYVHVTPSNKRYIGITCQNPIYRWGNGHNYKNNLHFYNAILKYGWDNIRHEILFTNLTKEEACQKEIELIARYKSNNPEFGYNHSTGGELSRTGCRGHHLSEETKEKLRQANLGKKASEETREKLRGRTPWNKGKPWSEEVRQRLSEVQKTKTGENSPRYGKKHSEETKQKIRDSLKRK